LGIADCLQKKTPDNGCAKCAENRSEDNVR